MEQDGALRLLAEKPRDPRGGWDVRIDPATGLHITEHSFQAGSFVVSRWAAVMRFSDRGGDEYRVSVTAAEDRR